MPKIEVLKFFKYSDTGYSVDEYEPGEHEVSVNCAAYAVDEGFAKIIADPVEEPEPEDPGTTGDPEPDANSGDADLNDVAVATVTADVSEGDTDGDANEPDVTEESANDAGHADQGDQGEAGDSANSETVGATGAEEGSEDLQGEEPVTEETAPPIDATPAARGKARELNIDLSDVVGTGDGGRIGIDDVRTAAGL